MAQNDAIHIHNSNSTSNLHAKPSFVHEIIGHTNGLVRVASDEDFTKMKQEIDDHYGVKGYDDIYTQELNPYFKGKLVIKSKLGQKGRSVEPRTADAESLKELFEAKLAKKIKHNIISNNVSKRDNFK